MRVAYADPPYPGQSSRYANQSPPNLPLLIEHLRTFDAWALSTSSAALRDVWNLAPEARCAAWTKTYASNGWSRVRWSWEPVLFVTNRVGLKPGAASTVWDSLVCAPDISRGWTEVAGMGGGSKPYPFVRWLLELLDYHDGDEFVDLFPGSGGVTAAAGIEQLEMLGGAT